jgi:hypothetical protein
VLLVGQIRAWWEPYLLQADPQRAARYRIMFGNTHCGSPFPVPDLFNAVNFTFEPH